MKASSIDEKKIQARAYQIYLERGRQPGHAMDDWLQAEYELMQLPIHRIAELKTPGPNGHRTGRSSLVGLVQAAILLGAGVLPHLEQTGG
jgi:hypothetical protein